ncbi:Ferredoxin-type protein NapF [Candidatus Entotheonellaceae bacterium PAL068K]
MAAKWGVFLCNCHQTLAIDSHQLDLPPAQVQCVSHPDTDVREFAVLAGQEHFDRVLISCCAPPSLFEQALGDGVLAPKRYFVNLKESCFWVHAERQAAHAKASRLIRAAMQAAEVQAEPAYTPLHVGGRILIATDTSLGPRLAAQLQGVAQPVLLLPANGSDLAARSNLRVYTGRIRDITGHLGDFQVSIEEAAAPEAPRRLLQTDQVVILSQHGSVPRPARTGCHVLTEPSAADLPGLARDIRDLMGDFLKTVHIRYRTDICAGGTADQEACGLCIPACPYDAIRRDRQNPLRMAVDHLACEGCGACVSACPTSALQFTEPSPHALYTRLAAVLAPLPTDNGGAGQVVLFHCGEHGKRVLEEAGRQSLTYPANLLPVEVPCLRYVSEANMLAAFRLGAAGVGLLGCETCQHGERQLLVQKIDFCKITLDAFDLGTERLRLITAHDTAPTEAVRALTLFVQTLEPTPIHWDGQPIRRTDNRQVIAGAIATFIEQVGREPGRRAFHAPQPFAFAEVQSAGCTLCRSCVNVCPSHAFKLAEPTASLQFKHLDCVACGLCETVCPEHVIALRRAVYFNHAALDYQTVVQDAMVSCVQCGKPYINRKALETIEARLLSLDSLLDTFTGPRRSLLRMCPDCRAVAAMLEVEKGWEP